MIDPEDVPVRVETVKFAVVTSDGLKTFCKKEEAEKCYEEEGIRMIEWLNGDWVTTKRR